MVQRDDFRQLEYGPWLLKFAVSLSWRILVINHSEVEEDVPHFKQQIQEALENWRLFLLGKRKQPGSQHHLFVMGIPESISPEAASKDLHPQTFNYLLRGIDATEFVTDNSVGVYAKMLRSIFYSPIVPLSANGWSNTRIHAGSGRLVSPQRLDMPEFIGFIQARIGELHSKNVSENQKRKISDAMLRDPERTIKSESFKVHQATRHLLGNFKQEDTVTGQTKTQK